jgi:dTDP-4-dehydrorhamnose reductase
MTRPTNSHKREWPAHIDDEAQLDELMTRPSPELVESMRRLEGDLLILGVAGKMGPTLARLARRALDEAGSRARVIGVARFSEPELRDRLNAWGVETITADLLDEAALAALPDAPNVVYLVGRKFGSSGDQALTWAMNTYLPGRVGERFRDSRIVALSTGNVYPLWPTDTRGPSETDPVAPVGEYAQSCLGRERMLTYMSKQHGTPLALIRLNYAIDLRYGVLIDIGRKVWTGTPVDLAMGYVNVIWQGDANTAVLRALEHAGNPPFVLNLTGLERLSVREIANGLSERLGRPVAFTGIEAPTALLSNARRYADLLGGPTVPVETMLDWVAHWLRIDGPTLGKPTKFEVRNGAF